MGVGVSVAVYENDTVYFYNYGIAKKETDELITRSHILEIGSITKTFTTTILADLVIKGTVSLEDPVTNYMPKYVNIPQRNGKQITLLDLATHRSALPRNPTNVSPKHQGNPFENYSVANMYNFLNNYKLTSDIGAE
jgi:D-alanyl-D-alanine-carboxypeptidase/D-alanyl-D-alanine-endopeptidase